MSRLHGLDDMFPADIDDAFEHEMRQLFVAAQSPGTTEELASEATIVAAMAHAVNQQTTSFQVSTRRATLARAIGSRAAKVGVLTGIAVISTSAAAAADLLPRPVQSAVERAVQYAGWQLSERDASATTTMEHSEPTHTTTTVRLEATVHPTMPPLVAVDRSVTTDELCHDWAFSIRSGSALEPNATRALIAMAERSGQGVERLCSPYAPGGSEVPQTTEAPTTPQDVPSSPPPTVSTVSAADVPPAGTAAPPTINETPNTSHTLPPQAHANRPPPGGGPSTSDHTNTGNRAVTPTTAPTTPTTRTRAATATRTTTRTATRTTTRTANANGNATDRPNTKGGG